MRDFKEIRVAVAGTGYVGLSIATLLSQHHHVTAVDVIPEKVEKLNNKVSPIQDDYIEKYLAEKPLDLVATLDGRSAYADADFVVIAAPTNYDPVKNYFDTSRVEESVPPTEITASITTWPEAWIINGLPTRTASAPSATLEIPPTFITAASVHLLTPALPEAGATLTSAGTCASCTLIFFKLMVLSVHSPPLA